MDKFYSTIRARVVRSATKFVNFVKRTFGLIDTTVDGVIGDFERTVKRLEAVAETRVQAAQDAYDAAQAAYDARVAHLNEADRAKAVATKLKELVA